MVFADTLTEIERVALEEWEREQLAWEVEYGEIIASKIASERYQKGLMERSVEEAARFSRGQKAKALERAGFIRDAEEMRRFGRTVERGDISDEHGPLSPSERREAGLPSLREFEFLGNYSYEPIECFIYYDESDVVKYYKSYYKEVVIARAYGLSGREIRSQFSVYGRGKKRGVDRGFLRWLWDKKFSMN